MPGRRESQVWGEDPARVWQRGLANLVNRVALDLEVILTINEGSIEAATFDCYGRQGECTELLFDGIVRRFFHPRQSGREDCYESMQRSQYQSFQADGGA